MQNPLIKALRIFKPLIIPIFLIALLQVTGGVSAISYASNWAILQSGLKDASVDEETTDKDFNFEFTIQDLKGNKIPFSQYKGKVIFLNLWATWCGPCRAEMAGIQKLYSNIDTEKVQFVMLSLDKDSDKPKVISYMLNKGFSFPGFMPSGYLPEELKVPAIPTTFIISKEGKVVRKEVGSMRYDTPKFQKFLEGLTE
jgi:thiol-disulfide isomerase/thioredoxin